MREYAGAGELVCEKNDFIYCVLVAHYKMPIYAKVDFADMQQQIFSLFKIYEPDAMVTGEKKNQIAPKQ